MSRYARDPRSGNFVLVAGDGSSGVEIDYSEYIQLSEEARNFGDYFVKNVPINSSILPIGGQIPISELYDDTPTIGSLKPVTSDGIARNIDSVTTDMNVIELTTTAEHAHSVGDYFMLIGQFVKCIAAIEIGDTIIIDTNVEATNIAEVLYQLNSKIGNTDISNIGSTITGAILNLDNKQVDFHMAWKKSPEIDCSLGFKMASWSVAESGYEPIGVLQINMSYMRYYLCGYTLSNNTMNFYYYGTATGSSPWIEVLILYRKIDA